MAKRSSKRSTKSSTTRAIVRSVPTGPKTINITTRAAPVKAPKHGGKRRGSGGSGSITDNLGWPAAAGLILGYIDKNPQLNIPTIPMLGRAGTLALAFWYFRGKHKTFAKIAGGMAAIAAYEWQREGSIAGHGLAAAS